MQGKQFKFRWNLSVVAPGKCNKDSLRSHLPFKIMSQMVKVKKDFQNTASFQLILALTAWHDVTELNLSFHDLYEGH